MAHVTPSWGTRGERRGCRHPVPACLSCGRETCNGELLETLANRNMGAVDRRSTLRSPHGTIDADLPAARPLHQHGAAPHEAGPAILQLGILDLSVGFDLQWVDVLSEGDHCHTGHGGSPNHSYSWHVDDPDIEKLHHTSKSPCNAMLLVDPAGQKPNTINHDLVKWLRPISDFIRGQQRCDLTV